MFDTAGRQPHVRPSGGRSDLDALATALNDLGFIPPARHGVNGTAVCGAAQKISVHDVNEGNDAGASSLRQLCRHISAGIPVNLSLENFGNRRTTIEALQSFCEIVATTLSWRDLSSRQLGLCIQSHLMPLEAYHLVAGAILGRGPRYVFLDSLQMSEHANRAVERRTEANWSFLWRLRGLARAVMPVYGGIVRSACPLLADEVATSVLPGIGLQCPANSAWLPLALPISRFSDVNGRLQWQALGRAIRDGLLLADQMFDCVAWHEPAGTSDSRQNRRLAISLCGIGDLVASRNDDPTSLACLNRLAQNIRRIRSTLHAESARIAGVAGAMPALVDANHVDQWSAGPQRDSWRQHWEAALRESAMRHRNLLVISPYAVLPAGQAAPPAYADLLPVIALADAWSFSEPPAFRGWDAARFRQFHRRARATIQGSHAASFIAAGA
jgi:hypothetical protein